MKKITKSIIALAVLAGLAGCAKEQTVATPSTPEAENKGKIALTLTAGKENPETASQENPETASQENPETRAAIDGTDNKVIDWSKNDKISVFDGEKTNCEFTLNEADAGKSTGKFSGDVTKTSESGYTALHPYQSGASYDGSMISGVVLKSTQTAVKDSFDPEAALMCARSAAAGEALAFKNVVGYVKFTTDFECSKITLVSNNADDKLAGTVTITPGDTPAVTVTDEATNQISLSAASGNIAAGTYYIAVLPETLTSGAKLFFTKTDGSQGYKSYSAIGEIKSNDLKNIKTTVSDSGLREDLSAPGTANCYLIKEAGKYAFKAVQGNTSTSVGSVNSVEVLWESFGTSTAPSVGDLVTSAKVNGEYIEFSTPATFKDGNAVIAAKDESGTILWSWHIWCATEGWVEQTYKNNAGIMMDRNLGATTATAGKVSSLGLLYQWGRKDPFRNASSLASQETDLTAVASTNSDSWKTSSSSASQALAKANPMTFYTGAGISDNGSWASEKTAYDPCPAGWRVPDGGSSGIWATAAGTTSAIKITGSSSSYGLNFSNTFGSGSSTIWYPATGFYNANGTLQSSGYYGDYWSVTTSGTTNAYYLDFGTGGDVNLSTGTHARTWGQTVRCQKIK